MVVRNFQIRLGGHPKTLLALGIQDPLHATACCIALEIASCINNHMSK